MPDTNAVEFNVVETFDALGNTADMLRALGVMMTYTVRSGDDVSEISDGMMRLIDQQCDDLKNIDRALRRQYRDIKENKLAIRDLRLVAEWSGTSPKLAAKVINIATGIDLDPASAMAEMLKSARREEAEGREFNETFGFDIAHPSATANG